VGTSDVMEAPTSSTCVNLEKVPTEQCRHITLQRELPNCALGAAKPSNCAKMTVVNFFIRAQRNGCLTIKMVTRLDHQ